MPRKTESRTVRLEGRITPETRAQIEALAREWGGPIRPLSLTDVVTEAVRRAAKKSGKIPDRPLDSAV